MQVGQEFFRWEIATAVAGAVIGINPFDQPDVEASKIETRKLTDAYEQTGSLPPEAPFARRGRHQAVRRSADDQAALGTATLAAIIKAHFARLEPGDYVGAAGLYRPRTQAHARP